MGNSLTGRRALLIAGESLIFVGSFVVAATIRFGELQHALEYPGLVPKALLSALCFQLALYYTDLYERVFLRGRVEGSLRIARAMMFGTIALQVVFYAIPSLNVGRGILALHFIVSYVTVVLWRLCCTWLAGRAALVDVVAILGTERSARHVADELVDQEPLGYRLHGFLTRHQPEVGRQIAGRRVLGTIADLLPVVAKSRVTRIVVALDDRRGTMPLRELIHCRLNGVQVEEAPDFYERLTGKILLVNLRPSWLVFSKGFNHSRLLRSQKVALEYVTAIGLLVLLAPLLVLIALAIKADSQGPVLYRQERVGEGNRRFFLFKFRSMRADAEASSGPVWAAEDGDSRVTRVGRILRKSRLDELPQIFNVLKGEMSFVGPRPERPHFVDRLRKVIPYYDERHRVKPGITGWAQVKFRYGATIEDTEEKLQFDLYYIKHMSWIFDIGIVVQTAKIALLGRGAR